MRSRKQCCYALGLLPDTQNYWLRMRRKCREWFPRYRLHHKPLVSDPGMIYATCVPGIPAACTPQFCASGKRPILRCLPCLYLIWFVNTAEIGCNEYDSAVAVWSHIVNVKPHIDSRVKKSYMSLMAVNKNNPQILGSAGVTQSFSLESRATFPTRDIAN